MWSCSSSCSGGLSKLQLNQLRLIHFLPFVVARASSSCLRANCFCILVLLGIGFLAVARTEEVVVAKGKLEPIGNVKEVRVPPGGVVEEILVENGERVTEGQALIRLDQESTAEQLKSAIQGVEE